VNNRITIRRITMQDLVRVCKAREKDLPFAPATLYKWNHLGKFPSIFRKIGGFLFVDLRALEALIESGGKTN
jgi:hypothetical protein